MSLCSTVSDLVRRFCPPVPPPPTPPASRYVVSNLVSDGSVTAPFTDPNLKNGWGVAFNPNGFVWVSAADSGKSTLYDGTGKPQTLVVTVPGVGGTQGSPTGIVFNGSGDFAVGAGTVIAPARFIFATEDGTISGWAANANPTASIITVDNSASDANYKGLAIGGNGNGNYLFATNFTTGRVDVFDATYKPVTRRIDMFVDPTMPRNYVPFGIQNIQGDIYVTYAKKTPGNDEEDKGAGFGYVSVFNTNGNFLRRVASQGTLNAPWGLALAPAKFGTYSNSLLVGNFGDGRISSFDIRTGAYLGQLMNDVGGVVSIDGLWGMQFGNGLQNQNTNALFFAAGPNDEAGGLYGRIDPQTV
jgi:uncharacterized protein (TIGR03118 family)